MLNVSAIMNMIRRVYAPVYIADSDHLEKGEFYVVLATAGIDTPDMIIMHKDSLAQVEGIAYIMRIRLAHVRDYRPGMPYQSLRVLLETKDASRVIERGPGDGE